MATDNESLVLSISADTRQIQRQLKNLIGQTERDTKSIEAAFGGIDKAATGAFNRVGANSNAAFTTAERGAQRFRNAMQGSSIQTSNLAAQLNDIGVQLAGGQSPFLIALQQGTQITQALGPGAGLRGTIGALAGAFTSVLNPVSLATIAIIGLGGEAIQYFTTLFSQGEKSEEVLKKQAQLIQQVADRWGDAVPSLREYADALRDAADVQNLNNVTDQRVGETWEVAKKAVLDLSEQIGALTQDLQAAGAESETVLSLQNAFKEVSASVADGRENTEAMEQVQASLAAALEQTGIPAIDTFRKSFEDLGTAIEGAMYQSRKLREEAFNALTSAQSRVKPLSPIFSDNGKLVSGDDFTPRGETPVPEKRPLVELEGLPGGNRRSGNRASSTSEADRERKAVEQLISQLRFEQETIGMSNEERAKANALRRAGAQATPQERAEIERLVSAIYTERDAIKANQEAMREFQEISRDALGSFISDLRQGKSATEALRSVLDKLADRLINGALDSLFRGFGGGGGALLGGTFTINIRSNK